MLYQEIIYHHADIIGKQLSFFSTGDFRIDLFSDLVPFQVISH